MCVAYYLIQIRRELSGDFTSFQNSIVSGILVWVYDGVYCGIKVANRCEWIKEKFCDKREGACDDNV